MSRNRFVHLAAVFFHAVFLLTAPPGFVSWVAADVPSELAGIDEYLDAARIEWDVPGLAVAVVKDDRLVYARGFGVKRIGHADPIDEHTNFAIGSASKAFTATALAMMIQDKRLAWDDKAADVLPDFRLYDPYVTRELTVRDLLCHRCGLARGDRLWYGSEFSRGEILRRVRHLEPSWSFRSNFGYQNIMYLAAGQIIPQRAGASWDAFVESRIFQPLGMRDSSTTIAAVVESPQAARPHAKIDDQIIAIEWRDLDNVAPAGSINSNVTDMAAWLRFQMAEGKFDGERLLRKSLVREMHTPQTIIRQEGLNKISYPDANFLNYGLGWFLQDYHGHKVVRHGGAIDGMRALVAMIPDEQLGVVVLTNLNRSMLCVPVTFRIFDAFLGRPPKDWSQELREAYGFFDDRRELAAALRRAGRKPGTHPSLPLEKYAGIYSHPMYGELSIQAEAETLRFRRGPQFVGELRHWHYDTFELTYEQPVLGKRFVSFRIDVGGAVEAIKIDDFAEFRSRSKARSSEK